MEIICKNTKCKKKFNKPLSVVLSGKGLFCSRKCCDDWGKNNFTGENSKNWKGGKKEKHCVECKENFYAYPYESNRKFCGNKCRAKHFKKILRAEKSHAWKGGITPIFLKIRNSEFYKSWRLKVFERDNFRCVKCGSDSGGDLNAHHIKRFSVILNDIRQKFPLLSVVDISENYKDLWDVSNGITLCEKCHRQEHKKK